VTPAAASRQLTQHGAVSSSSASLPGVTPGKDCQVRHCVWFGRLCQHQSWCSAVALLAAGYVTQCTATALSASRRSITSAVLQVTYNTVDLNVYLMSAVSDPAKPAAGCPLALASNRHSVARAGLARAGLAVPAANAWAGWGGITVCPSEEPATTG
jgi:hypothetical protein